MKSKVNVDGYEVTITNPNKVLWKKSGLTKLDYIERLVKLWPYMKPYAMNRLLTTIRYPDGVHKKSFYQKNKPTYGPDWVETIQEHKINYIHLNHLAVLIWLGNQAAIEYHTSFNTKKFNHKPSSLVFDLDPSEEQHFEQVIDVALIIYETLNKLEIESYVKTSGSTGLQIYIPLCNKYTYDEARQLNLFFGRYFAEKYPDKITIERSVKKRGQRLYFDYLQMWEGKTIIMPYSPRATEEATVATPLDWEEVRQGCKPVDFNLFTIDSRLKEKGDLFEPLLTTTINEPLEALFKSIQ